MNELKKMEQCRSQNDLINLKSREIIIKNGYKALPLRVKDIIDEK
jgi:hypothetical protein